MKCLIKYLIKVFGSNNFFILFQEKSVIFNINDYKFVHS